MRCSQDGALQPKVHNQNGFDEAKVRTVSENAQTLKFDQSGFEDE